MTKKEHQLVETLKRLIQEYGAAGVKAEYEAEGSRYDELLRFRDLAEMAGAAFTLKVGGCMASRDLLDARMLAVDHLVGPMIESPYALELFLEAVAEVFPGSDRAGMEILINVETIGTFHRLDELYSCPAFSMLDGIVLGRGDLVESMGLARQAVDSDACFDIAAAVVRKAKGLGKVTMMGGSLTAASVPFIRRLPADLLDIYETRKVCFNTKEALARNPEQGIALALDFELLWLEIKHQLYHSIAAEDLDRIAALRARKN